MLGFILSLVVAWFIRDVMPPFLWVLIGVVFLCFYKLTSYAYAKNPLDRPPNPLPLQTVNMLVGNTATVSFAAAVFSLLF